MADEELAPDEGLEPGALLEGQEPDPNTQADDPVANLARDLGWRPKEEFKGNPDDWKPADEFIRTGRDVQRTTARELREVKSQLSNIARVTDTIFEDRWKEREAEILSARREAIEAGDVNRVEELDTARDRLRSSATPGQRDTPEVAEFKSRNAWFERDPVARNLAIHVCGLNANLAPGEQLKIAEEEVKRRFPEHFPAPVKPQAQVNEPNGRGPGRKSNGKTFADLPKAAQDIAIKFENERGVPRAEYAAKYFTQQEKVG